MDNTSNSNKSRVENRVKVKSVVETPGVKKEDGAIEKFSKAFLAQDLKSVMLYLLKDEFVPNFKKMLYQGFGMMLGIDTNDISHKNSDRASYRDYYDRGRRRGAAYENPREDNRIVHDYVSTKFYSRSDAESVKAELEAIIEADGYATINDLYVAANMKTRDYTYNNWGWGDLRGARVISEFSYKEDRTFWYLKMPKAYPVGAE